MERIHHAKLEKEPTWDWFKSDTGDTPYKRAFEAKLAALHNPDYVVLQWFHPYFGDIMKHCVRNYIRALFGETIHAADRAQPLPSIIKNSASRWDAVRQVLQETASQLREDRDVLDIADIDWDTSDQDGSHDLGPIDKVLPEFRMCLWVGLAGVFV